MLVTKRWSRNSSWLLASSHFADDDVAALFVLVCF
jgi:hypothetical protein